jgi:hypothetical protein
MTFPSDIVAILDNKKKVREVKIKVRKKSGSDIDRVNDSWYSL